MHACVDDRLDTREEGNLFMQVCMMQSLAWGCDEEGFYPRVLCIYMRACVEMLEEGHLLIDV